MLLFWLFFVVLIGAGHCCVYLFWRFFRRDWVVCRFFVCRCMLVCGLSALRFSTRLPQQKKTPMLILSRVSPKRVGVFWKGFTVFLLLAPGIYLFSMTVVSLTISIWEICRGGHPVSLFSFFVFRFSLFRCVWAPGRVHARCACRIRYNGVALHCLLILAALR